jgi:general stress protein 26
MEIVMSKTRDIEQKFWKALASDRTVMLGLPGVDGGHTRPMTAQVENGQGPIWFFTSADTAIVEHVKRKRRAFAAFSAKGHDLFATIHGDLAVDQDAAVIERLWNPFIAAWFDGKDDPKLRLLRFDADQAEVWLNENNLLAGIKMLFGVDPKRDYADKVAEIDLG